MASYRENHQTGLNPLTKNQLFAEIVYGVDDPASVASELQRHGIPFSVHWSYRAGSRLMRDYSDICVLLSVSEGMMIAPSCLPQFASHLLLPGLFVLMATTDIPAQTSGNLSFRPAPHETFSFDTGAVRGKLRTEQFAFGLHNLEYGTAGTELAGRYGLMNVYRVFANGKRYGVAGWEWPSRVQRLDDGAVVVDCPADSSRPFQLRGIYRWMSPTTLDLEIQVLPQRELKGFEVFLASYFDPRFSSCQANVRSLPDQPDSSGFLSAKESFGDWLMFPRDKAAVKLVRDGRWELLPHPVHWKILPQFERPLVVRRDVGGKTAVLLMARATDCFALAMPYETEGHYSVYLSLFGRDLPPGKRATVKTRLQVLETPSEAEIVESFQIFDEAGR